MALRSSEKPWKNVQTHKVGFFVCNYCRSPVENCCLIFYRVLTPCNLLYYALVTCTFPRVSCQFKISVKNRNSDALSRAKELRFNYLLLTNRVRGQYWKLRTELFSRWFMTRAHKSTGKKRGSITYSTDRENEVSKIFIISEVNRPRGKGKTFKFSGPYSGICPQNWPITPRVLTERYNN